MPGFVQEAPLLSNPILLLIGNKNDLPDRQVTFEEGQALADKYGMLFMETSAKEPNERFALISKLKEAADKYKLNS